MLVSCEVGNKTETMTRHVHIGNKNIYKCNSLFYFEVPNICHVGEYNNYLRLNVH